jgi:hypothetical protein
MATKKKSKSPVKATVKKRTLNQSGTQAGGGAPFNDQDAKRRLGNFEGAGEHPRVGGRTSGIVGQTTKTFRTDNRKKGSK